MSSTNVDSTTNAAYSYIANAGVGLVFGLGYCLFKYLYGSDKPEENDSGKNLQNCWTTAQTVDEINSLIKKNESDSSLNPFEVLETIKKKMLTPDVTTYNNLLNACYVVQNFNIADKLTEEILGYGSSIQIDTSTYNILLKGISCKLDVTEQEDEKRVLLEKAQTYFEDVEKKGLKYGDITINTMLDIYIKTSQFNKAWDLFDNMEKKYEIEPDKYSYSTIIKALKYDEDPSKVEKAFGVLEYLKKKNVTGSDEIIFNCLLEVCLKFKMVDKAEKLFSEMKTLGVNPSKITYAIMIKGYGMVYDLEKAMKMFKEMKEADIQPNEVIYGCLLNVCVKCYDIKKTNEVYQQMQADGIPMNIILYTTLLKSYAKAKQLDKAFEIYEKMLKDSSITPNIVICNAMLDACIENEDYKKMTEIYESIKKKALEDESSPIPDLITYSTVIKGYCRAKDIKSALKIYEFLKEQESEFTKDEVLYNSLLDGCVKTQNYAKALEIKEDMDNHQIKLSNVTYSILVKLYANKGETDKALKILDEMRQNNIKPGVIVYTCLIQCSFKSGKYLKAIELFETLKKEGLTVDYVLYNTIVNGCLYHSQWDSAYKYTMESFKTGVKMAYNIYKNVLEKLTMNYCHLPFDTKVKYTQDIVNNLQDRGVKVDDETFKKVAALIYKTAAKDSGFSRDNHGQRNYGNRGRKGGNKYYKSYNNFNK
ncbi:MAG: hypothetical protein MJ252_24195 [archaeon]|nr:hypothetical protein [archaeon]